MRRFFAENIDTSNDTVMLCGDEARHILTVLRMGCGDTVLLMDGNGTECVAQIENCDNNCVTLTISEKRTPTTEPTVEITLFQCLPKQGKMEVIIQKCVELGISKIVPVTAKRCVVKLDKVESRIARWNKVAVEASKQCGRAYVPKVAMPTTIDKINVSCYDTALIAYENESEMTLKRFLRANKRFYHIAMLIGPEGGFETEEVERLLSLGGIAVSLGRRILRTETAGMAMLAQLMYELED